MKKIIILVLLLMIPTLVNAETNYLYDVLKNEAENNGLAREYTGEHKDSFTKEPTKKIYHWYAENDEEGNQILDKNNVIFGNHCWQILRTTDTGGVKLIYNGEVENNQCLNTRGKHAGYVQYLEKQTLSTNYYYGTDYSYDKENNLFSLSGNIVESTWNDSNSASLIGKYTCKQATQDATCSKLYYVESYVSNTQANVIPLNGNASYYEYGELALQANAGSAAGAGYMYGDTSPIKTIATLNNQDYTTRKSILQNTAINNNHWYANSINYDPNVSNHFSLDNPFQVTNADEYSNIIGKYTLRNTNSTASYHSAFYIAGISGNTTYYRTLTYPPNMEYVTKIAMADSISDNGNGTYSLNDPTLVDYTIYFNNYENYKNKYTCGDNTTTCEQPLYITSTLNNMFYYLTINSGNNIVIAKERNGLNLVDTLTIDPALMIINRDNYTDYHYTCNNDSSTCTEDNLRYIYSYTETGYKYATNHYFAESVTWDEDHYVLNDYVDMESFLDLDKIKTHHYFCIENGKKGCESVGFIHRYTSVGATFYYDLISNGVRDINEALNIMWTKNNIESLMKKGVDAWYEKHLIDYTDFIEDTIYCNDRRARAFNGWNPNNTPDGYIYFAGVYTAYNKDLSCPNITDQFSTINPQAKLKYPIALGTKPELNLMNNDLARKSGNYYWLMTPGFVNELYGRGLSISPAGNVSTYYNSTHAMGVRPVISLISKIRYSEGTGSMDNPYKIIYNKYYNIGVEINNETEDLTVEIDDLSQVPEGEEVNFKVTPIKGHKITSIRIVDENNNEVDYTTTDNKNYKFIMPSLDVTIIPSYERVKNAVNVEDNNNTKEFVIEVNDATAVVYEDTVRFKLEPEEGYEVDSIDIRDEENNEISYKKTKTKNEYEFTMPDTDVTISPKYRKIETNTNTNSIINPNTKRQILLIVISLIILGIVTITFIKKKKRLN